ncbi:hypothetical protein HY490_00965, partial [Candidatus Woesearchaeota archaeon]|nr:hypothetical protein [Candidatus Woesearchaeota archaeon]
MSESGDSWDPGPWKGWSYTSARAAHDPSAGRGYGSRAGNASSAYDSSGRSYAATPPKSVSTDSPSPLVIAVDVTGSMGVFPETMFKKLPLLDLEMKEYLDNPEICFIAVGDAYCDSHPLQVQEFAKGKDLVDRLNGIHIEGGGGGQIMESYDLATVYGAHNIKMPKANRPIFIYVGDEGFYDTVDPDQAKRLAHVDLEKRLTSKQAVDDLKKKFSAVYCVRKLYDGSDADHMSSIDKTLHAQWTKYLGDDKVVILNEPG